VSDTAISRKGGGLLQPGWRKWHGDNFPFGWRSLAKPCDLRNHVDVMPSAKVIILNGIGSVGKSSTAKAVQSLAIDTFFHVQGDAFLDMLPAKMWGHVDGIKFSQQEEHGKPSVVIEMGSVLTQLMQAMRTAISAMARQGHNLIVDDVMLTSDDQKSYREGLAGCEVYYVGLFAPLDVLEQRERDRGDRLHGLARWQHDRVHKGILYDLEIDTSVRSPKDCATMIASAFGIG
jgi:chloramphenicol 3-O phosphotransferase